MQEGYAHSTYPSFSGPVRALGWAGPGWAGLGLLVHIGAQNVATNGPPNYQLLALISFLDRFECPKINHAKQL
jgi:hypothetical protein